MYRPSEPSARPARPNCPICMYVPSTADGFCVHDSVSRMSQVDNLHRAFKSRHPSQPLRFSVAHSASPTLGSITTALLHSSQNLIWFLLTERDRGQTAIPK